MCTLRDRISRTRKAVSAGSLSHPTDVWDYTEVCLHGWGWFTESPGRWTLNADCWTFAGAVTQN